VKTWYNIYHEKTPILITDWNGRYMTGLLALSFFGKNSISAAGFDQAEYQVWLSTPESNDSFISKTISELFIKFPRKVLHLKYLPSKTPISFFEQSLNFKNQYYLKAYVQPLIQKNKIQLESELKKKNRKEKINRLKRIGDLQFYEIKNIDEFRKNFDEMAM
jgi:hypothetical protein